MKPLAFIPPRRPSPCPCSSELRSRRRSLPRSERGARGGASAASAPSARQPRGAALLVALVAIAILTALAVDLAYQTQVRLRIASAGRDQLRAQGLAQSGITLSRLVLGFQAQLDQASSSASQAFGALTGASAAGGQGQANAAFPRVQVWSVVPVGSMLTDSLFPSEEGARPASAAVALAKPADGAPAVATAPLADFQGGFDARIEDEGQKVNVQLDTTETSGVLPSQVEALLRITCDAKWDPLFDREDAYGQRYTRKDLVQNLRDWVNTGNVTSSLMATFPAGNCAFVFPAGNVFENGFGDKNVPYDRGEDRYKTKNARMDSLEELHQVAGVSDAFMAAFADQLTAYLPLNAQINVNSDDPLQQLRIAWQMADPASYPTLLDPAFAPVLHKTLTEARMGGVLSLTPAQFKTIVEALGVKTRNIDLTSANKTSPFTDRSVVYKVRAIGRANDVTHAIEAVFNFDPNAKQFDANGQLVQQAQQQGQLPAGRLIRWREE